MSVVEDIGKLKADMATVKGEASRISNKIDAMSAVLTAHASHTLVRLEVMEERHDVLSDHVEDHVDPHITSFLKFKASARGMLLGIGVAAGLVSGALVDIVKVFWKGDVS